MDTPMRSERSPNEESKRCTGGLNARSKHFLSPCAFIPLQTLSSARGGKQHGHQTDTASPISVFYSIM